MKPIHAVFVPVVLAVLLSGCSGAVSSSEPTADLDPATELIGSWYRSETEIDSGGREEQNEIVLTLTSERYIYSVIEYDENGEFETHNSGNWSGEWTASDATIATTTKWWDRDEADWSEVHTYEKSYTLNDDVLQVDEWNQFDPEETPERETYTRHQGISDVTGTWLQSWTGTVDGHAERLERTFEITASTFRGAREDYSDGMLVYDWYIEGSITVDYSLNYIHVEITDHEILEDGEPSKSVAWTDHTVRYAFAPTSDPNKIAISRVSSEQYYDGEENAWKDRIIYPWGVYRIAERQ